MEIMPHVGIQLGHVIERKRLEREVDSAAAEQQRHIGRELHDSISQELTGIGMMAETLRARLVDANVDSTLVNQSERLTTHLRSAQKQVSQLSRGLVPAEVEAEGLVSALEDLVSECNELRGESACKFRCNDTILVEDRATATNLYRIAQEAIQNAWKHARPTFIVLSLALKDGDLVLSIENDGVQSDGVQSDGAQSDGDRPFRLSRGRGLRIMQYRAGLIGARLSIDSKGGRFSVTCRLHMLAQQS
jgi:signal transduction histidine kinase